MSDRLALIIANSEFDDPNTPTAQVPVSEQQTNPQAVPFVRPVSTGARKQPSVETPRDTQNLLKTGWGCWIAARTLAGQSMGVKRSPGG